MEESNQSARTENQSTPPIGAILQGIGQNPEMLARLGSIMEALKGQGIPTSQAQEAQAPSPAAEERQVPPDTASVPASSEGVHPAGAPGIDGLSALLSNPAMLEKLPSMLSAMGPMLATAGAGGTQEKHPTPSPACCRDNLLLSLRPFLSPPRQTALDSILKIAKLGAMLEQIKP
ncbi:MAG: hypothetical protein IKB75_00830 [Clostridia bacterium]|nr:hypothetical protein [Clostridia bacterium]